MLWQLILQDEAKKFEAGAGNSTMMITGQPPAAHQARLDHIWQRALQLAGGDVGKALFIAAAASGTAERWDESRKEYRATMNGIPSQAFGKYGIGDDKPQHFFTLALISYRPRAWGLRVSPVN